MARLDDPRDFLSRLWISHGHRQTFDIGGGPFRIAVHLQVFVIGTDAILGDGLSQFEDGLIGKPEKSSIPSAGG